MWLARLTKSLSQPESNLNTIPLLLNASCFTISEHSYILYKVWKRHTAERQWQNLFSPAPPLHTATHWILLIALDCWPLPIARWPLTIARWPLTIDPWPLPVDRCLLTVASWLLTIDHWPLTIDCWPLTIDCWPLTIDPWLLTVDRWPSARKWKKYLTEYLPVMKKVVLLHADYYHDEPQKGSDSLWKGVSSIGLERCPKGKQGDKL